MHTPHLTLSDRWILLMLAAGHSRKTVADELGITLESVKHRLIRVRRHYQARNNTQAVANAYRRGDL